MDSSFNLCAFADEAAQGLDGQMEALRGNAISLLELRGIDGRNVSELQETDARRIRRELDARGLKVWSIGSPTGKIGLADDFGPHLDVFRRMVSLSAILGASRYRLFSFYGAGQDDASRDMVIERLSRFLETAEGSGLTLCHENEKHIFGEKAASCLAIHKALPALRAVFDPANFVQAGQDTLEAWDLLEPYVDYMHVKDALADGRVVPPGKGNGHLPALLRRYRATGGRVLSVEPHLSSFVGLQGLEQGHENRIGGWAYPTPRAAFDAAVGALKGLLNE